MKSGTNSKLLKGSNYSSTSLSFYKMTKGCNYSTSFSFLKYSPISVIRTSIIPNYWAIRRQQTVSTFFFINYCNKTTDYSNYDYPKNSFFRSDSSVPIKEIAIKLPFKIRSPNVTHGDHDCFVWSSSGYTSEWFSKQSCTRLTLTLLRDEPLSEKMVCSIKVVCNDGFVWCFLNV